MKVTRVRGADGLAHIRQSMESGRTLCQVRSHGTMPTEEEMGRARCTTCEALITESAKAKAPKVTKAKAA